MKRYKYLPIFLFLSVTIFCLSCEKTVPLKKPYVKFPENNSVLNAIPLKLEWGCSDFDSQRLLTYDLYFGTTNTPELIASDISASSYTDFEIKSEQSYYWKVVAKDEDGNHSEGSLWQFSIGNLSPENPRKPFPNHNSIDQKPIEITWECFEPEDESLSYDIYFGTSDMPEIIEEDYSENTYELPELKGNQKYYWRIIAKDSHGNETAGPLWEFTTTFFPPALLFPVENSENAAWFPIFKWSNNNSGEHTYDLHLGTTNNPELLVSNLSEKRYHLLVQLEKGQSYYWKVVSKNEHGETLESPVQQFTVFGDPVFGSFTDARDGTVYQTVTIGRQTWMAENLKYVVEGSKVYDDDPLNEDIYGRLYNWYQIMNGEEASNENPGIVQGIAPDGWHIPSQAEWDELIHFLGGRFDGYAYFSNAAAGLKESGTEHWLSGNTGNNESGFTALPGGRFNSYDQAYYWINERGYFWSSSINTTKPFKYSMNYDKNYVNKWDVPPGSWFLSLRCVKD